MEQSQTLNLLFELAKFDMQQIQNYREAIMNTSIIIIGSSFGVSAYLYGKSSALCDKSKRTILAAANVGLLMMLLILARSYFQGLDASRVSLDGREKGLKIYIASQVLDKDSFYPKIEGVEPSMNLNLEKMPLRAAIGILSVKTLLELMCSMWKEMKEARE